MSSEELDLPAALLPGNQSGAMSMFIHHLVSQKKTRFIRDGYDLDLAYITPRLIAMGFPSTGISPHLGEVPGASGRAVLIGAGLLRRKHIFSYIPLHRR